MKVRSTLHNIENYFLDQYREKDFVTYQKARTFLAILLTILLIVTPSFFISNILRVTGVADKLAPSGMFFICLGILALLKKGKINQASHVLLVSSFMILWSLIFFGDDRGNVITKTDTIALILALLTVVPLVITRRARDILIYFMANSAILTLLCLWLKPRYNFTRGLLWEYFLDNFIAMVFIGVTSYLIYIINRKALEKAFKAEMEVQAQNEELRASNEEFEAMNEELISSQQELKAQGDALKLSEERYRNIIESMEEGYFEVDLGGKFTFMNRSVETQYGYTRDELLGMDNRAYTSKESAAKIYQIFKKIYNTGKPERIVDYEVLTKDGTKKTLEISASLLKDHKDQPCGFRGVIRDVTRRIKEEREIQKIKKIESIGLLAGGIAHDFNNILTAVVGNISLAKNDLGRESGAYDLLDAAEKASLRARDLTQQLLTFSKGGAPIKKITTINDMLIDIISFVLRGSKVSARFVMDKDLHNVEIDSGQISQVIHNLIINADQAMPDGGTITVTAENMRISEGMPMPLPDGEYVMIAITDQGKGISEADLPCIFDPYFTTKQDGTGLGLTISYSIIKNHGGLIAAESTTDKGATFKIYLPASGKSLTPGPEKAPSTALPDSIKKNRIMIMDDDDMVAEITGTIISRMGLRVSRVSNGHEAIRAYEKAIEDGDPYGLVIMDLTIPGSMGGREAIAALRERDPEIKAVVSSGYSHDPVMARYGDFGFCGFIVKPYTADDLNRVIMKILG